MESKESRMTWKFSVIKELTSCGHWQLRCQHLLYGDLESLCLPMASCLRRAKRLTVYRQDKSLDTCSEVINSDIIIGK